MEHFSEHFIRSVTEQNLPKEEIDLQMRIVQIADKMKALDSKSETATGSASGLVREFGFSENLAAIVLNIRLDITQLKILLKTIAFDEKNKSEVNQDSTATIEVLCKEIESIKQRLIMS